MTHIILCNIIQLYIGKRIYRMFFTYSALIGTDKYTVTIIKSYLCIAILTMVESAV